MVILTPSSEKRKHKASRYNTRDYHSDVVSKRPKTTVTSSKTAIPSHRQRPITTFFVEPDHHEEIVELKKEDYFKVPLSKKGFNLLSLRHTFSSIKTNANIVGLIKKNVLNNNIVKWTVQSKLHPQRKRKTVALIENNDNDVDLSTYAPFVKHNISRDYHRL